MSKICYDIQTRLIRSRKKYLEINQELKFTFQNMQLLNILNTNTAQNLRWSKIRCIICRQDLHNLKTRKKLKTCIIVRIELCVNENTLKDLQYK